LSLAKTLLDTLPIAPESAAGYTRAYLAQVQVIAAMLDPNTIDRMVALLLETRERGGRLFFLGVGGGAGHAGHAVNDFRKIAGIESYAPTDNVSELTARINDEGWESCFAAWLRGSHLSPRDLVFVFSVGGGNLQHRLSLNLIASLDFARSVGARILGIVGRDGGYTAQLADVCLVIPTIDPEAVTPHTEEFQAVVWHLIVSHPLLRAHEMKWESKK
jgi:D-sedoheptulose 7-phosphate isomerase